jgi:hypothetical protein
VNHDATRVFLPLRSNTAWFSDESGRLRFEALLKTHIALYDRVILEDGRLEITSDGRGQGMTIPLAPNSIPQDRRQINYFKSGGTFAVQVGNTPILHGNAAFGCSADFFPILSSAGLQDATYLEWFLGDLVDEIKQQCQGAADRDLYYKDGALVGTLPNDRYMRKEIVKGFYRDSLIAHFKGATIGFDEHIRGFLDAKRVELSRSPSPAVQELLFQRWIDLGLPDFSQYSWEEIHVLHESDAGNDLRRMIARISNEAMAALQADATDSDLREIVAKAFEVELVQEIRVRRANARSVTISLALNFVPYGGIASGLLELNALSTDKASWVSLL